MILEGDSDDISISNISINNCVFNTESLENVFKDISSLIGVSLENEYEIEDWMYVFRIKNLNGFCSYCKNLNTVSLINVIDENCEFG